MQLTLPAAWLLDLILGVREAVPRSAVAEGRFKRYIEACASTRSAFRELAKLSKAVTNIWYRCPASAGDLSQTPESVEQRHLNVEKDNIYWRIV